MRADRRARLDDDTGADHRIGADLHAGGELGRRIDDRGRVDRGHVAANRRYLTLRSVHMIPASAASWPSTVARVR